MERKVTDGSDAVRDGVSTCFSSGESDEWCLRFVEKNTVVAAIGGVSNIHCDVL